MYLINQLEILCKDYGRYEFTNPILAKKTAEEIVNIKIAIEKYYLGYSPK